MTFMNEYDIQDAASRYANHPTLGPAVLQLLYLVNWTNHNSDGWAYWPKPCRAAAKLQALIQGERLSRFDDERADATPAALRAALAPIKAFRTRQGADFTIVDLS